MCNATAYAETSALYACISTECQLNVVGFIELIIFFATESTCRDPNTCVRPSKLNQMNSLFCLQNIPTTIPLLK